MIAERGEEELQEGRRSCKRGGGGPGIREGRETRGGAARGEEGGRGLDMEEKREEERVKV